MYIVIIGAGEIGMPLIEMATEEGNEVVVIEKDRELADRAASEYDCLVLHDDATRKEALLDADVDIADALISTTDQDATNIMVCLLATELEIPHIVSVVHNPDHMSLFRRIGVNTMGNPQRLISEHLYRAVKRPAIIDFMQLNGAAEVFEISVSEDAPIAGKTLREADSEGILPEDMLIIAIERGEDEPPLTPKGGTRIEPGAVLTVYSASGATPDTTDVFGHIEDHE